MEMLWLQCAGPNKETHPWKTVSPTEGDPQQELEGMRQSMPDLQWRLATEDQVSNKTDGSWSISLDVECPYCKEMFDLTADGEVWESEIEPIEHGTDRTEGYEVECPGCDRLLSVDFSY